MVHSPLRRMVKGRSVSLVGSSSILLDSGLGTKIDSADLVVRIHAIWPHCGVAMDACEDIGFKTDILVLYANVQDDTRRVSVFDDLKLVVWFNGIDHEHLIPVHRYLRVMGVEEMAFEEYYEDSELMICTKVFQALMKCSPSHLYLCGTDENLNSINTRTILESADSRVEYARHTYPFRGVKF